jgi:hypothetical protein
VRFYRVLKGRREQLKGANTKVATGQWHTLGLRAEATASPPLSTASRCSPPRTRASPIRAKVALWTKVDSVAHFDTITIMPLD